MLTKRKDNGRTKKFPFDFEPNRVSFGSYKKKTANTIIYNQISVYRKEEEIRISE